MKRRRYNVTGVSDIKPVTKENGKKGSPEVNLKSLDPSAMFGSVAFVRGMAK